MNACFANDENLADNKVDEDKIRAVRQPPLKHKANAVDGKHFALLISVNEYNQINGLSPLRYCDNDMAGLENELKKFDFEVIRMHAKAEDSACHVNRTNVKEQLKRILDQATGENDVLLIAYSGHGVQEGNTRYLCPPNTPKNYDLGDLIPLYVDANNIADRSYGILNIVESRFGEKQFSGTCFLFIDACRNGNRTETKTLFPETGKFHIFSSCRPGEVSYEEERFQNGRFMHFVIQALNVDENENLVYEHLTSQVARQMSAFGKNQQRIQTPTRHDTAYEINGQLIFGQRKPDKFSMIPLMTGASLILRESKSPESQSHVVHKPVVSPTNPRNTQMLNATNQWPDFSTKDQEEQNVISDIVQLPGLNGEWWFQETPWYIPHARLALTYVLSDYSFGDQTYWRSGKDFLGKNIYAYLNTNTHDARELLWKYLNSDECKSIIPPDVMETIKELKKGIARSANSRELQYKKLKTFLENLQKNRKNVYNGIDLYTFAVFRHQMALLADNVTRSLDTENAKRSYRNAIAILKQDCESESQSTAILFYQLCLADYARFLAEVEGNASSHTETFKELVASFKSSYKHSLFQIAVYTDNAVNESNFGRLRESVRSFREAESKIAESKIAKTGHPLIASYHEQYGWNRIDYWRLIPAKESFETALLIREYNAWSSSSPIDMMYVTYGLHAMGTVSRFAGNNEKAKGYFKEAKEAIKKIRDNISEDSLSLTKNRLDEREASTLERLADLTLYYGAVSETEWIKALDDYARGATITNKTTTTKTRLLSKRALLLLRKEIPDQYRSEKNKFDEARDCLKEAHVAVEQSLENPSSNTTIPLIFFKAALI
ncbi:MAG: caspase family protein, partial [Planctomycetaceae bacterium]|nr:caspase family protein [Planctomycetaceae bacterium]